MTTTASERAMARAFMLLIGAPYSSRVGYAIIAWVRSETGRTIVGNNPWNQHAGPPCSSIAGSVVKCNGRLVPHSQRIASAEPCLIGNRYAGPSDRNVAIYSSIGCGLQTSADNLLSGFNPRRAWTGYDHVVVAARKNDPRGFMEALAASAWAADRYGTKNGGENRLIKVYQGIVSGLGAWYQV